ncbi:MAG: hypothetical protein JWM56_767 [Candidatus Peribacteria bacterium]|nr:hypothetical protein [Candidatus Peribacteria bacterium]
MIPWILLGVFWCVAWHASSQFITCKGIQYLSWIEYRALTLLGMIVFPLMLTYAFAHIMPMQTATFLCFFLLTCIAIVKILKKRKGISPLVLKISRDAPPQWVQKSCIILIIAVIPFFLRSLSTDSGSWNRYPLAKTISEGNIPVHTPIEPDQIFSYHFGPEFFEAILHTFAGVSLPLAYSSLLILCFICTLYTSIALLRRWKATWSNAFLGGFFCLFAGGLVWLNGLYYWLSDMFQYFIVHVPMSFPFARFSWLFAGGIAPALISNFLQPTVGLGSPILLGCLLIFSISEQAHPQNKQWILGILLLASLTAMALCMESSLGILVVSIFILTAWYFLRRTWCKQKQYFFHSPILWIIFCMSMGIIVIQGGILTTAFFHALSPVSNQTMGSLYFNPKAVCFLSPFQFSNNPNSCFSIFEFIRDFGVCIFIQILCWVIIIRKKITQPSFIILTISTLIFFTLPFIFTHPIAVHDLRRLWLVHLFFMMMVTPLLLQESGFASNLPKKVWLKKILIFSLSFSAVLYIATHTLMPDMRFHSQPLLASLSTPSTAQSDLYKWILSHTNQQDYFFQFTSRNYNFPLRADSPQYMLMVNTGRFSIGPWSGWAYDPIWMENVFKFEEQCTLPLAHSINIGYILLEGADRHQWFQSHCRLSDWTIIYKGKDSSYPITILQPTVAVVPNIAAQPL